MTMQIHFSFPSPTEYAASSDSDDPLTKLANGSGSAEYWRKVDSWRRACLEKAEELGLEHTHVVKPPRKARKARAATSTGTGRRGRPAAVAAE